MELNLQEKDSQLSRLLETKIARTAFDLVETSGSPDRRLAEMVTQEGILIPNLGRLTGWLSDAPASWYDYYP